MSALHGLFETAASLVSGLWPAAFWWLVAVVGLAALLDRPEGGGDTARRD